MAKAEHDIFKAIIFSSDHPYGFFCQQTKDKRSDIQTIARKIGVLNILIGMLGFIGPAVKGNDDQGAINMNPELFLGVIAINARHNLLHIVVGALGVQASRDATSTRQYMGFSAALISLFAVAVWKELGFDRDVHIIRGVAMNWWAISATSSSLRSVSVP